MERLNRFVMADLQPNLVKLHGRNMLRICDYILLRRMPWIRLADRDFRAADDVAGTEPIFTRFEVADWKRPEESHLGFEARLARADHPATGIDEPQITRERHAVV